MTDAEIVSYIVGQFEGAVANHPSDLDGPLPTNWGVTAGAWRDYYGREPTAADILALTRAEAEGLLLEVFVRRPRLGAATIADDRLRFAVIDYAIHAGPAAAIRALQLLVKVAPVDGYLGPRTEHALSTCDPVAIHKRLLAGRLRQLAHQIVVRPDQAVFAAGWMNRIAALLVM